jgi:oxygen-independent coproporphyrinogen-3 oxidase
MALGLYLSVPFCRTKCSYCNFASDVFSRAMFAGYIDRICADIERATRVAEQMGGQFENSVDTVYLGGGTPTLLDSAQLQRLFVTIRQNFCLQPETEITVECAPGTLTTPVLEVLLRCRVNRVSLGVQSFVNAEAAAVGRLHKRATVFEDLENLRAAGIANINIDLIAGLPHQTAASWHTSLSDAIATAAPHISVYMLEADEDSRLGRELIAGGTRYHAHSVPSEDATADFYLAACQRLNTDGVRQYEISNFARRGFESRHNLKYWARQPYLGFGVDAHSMLEVDKHGFEAIRFATPDSLEDYVAAKPLKRTPVSHHDAIEETFFLGLRLMRGVDLKQAALRFGAASINEFAATITELLKNGLLESDGSVIRLTSRGRLLSNEVFEKFITVEESVG